MSFVNLTHFECKLAATLAIDMEAETHGNVNVSNGADSAATLTIDYRNQVDDAVTKELSIELTSYECRALAHALTAMAAALDGPRTPVGEARKR